MLLGAITSVQQWLCSPCLVNALAHGNLQQLLWDCALPVGRCLEARSRGRLGKYRFLTHPSLGSVALYAGLPEAFLLATDSDFYMPESSDKRADKWDRDRNADLPPLGERLLCVCADFVSAGRTFDVPCKAYRFQQQRSRASRCKRPHRLLIRRFIGENCLQFCHLHQLPPRGGRNLLWVPSGANPSDGALEKGLWLQVRLSWR